MSSTQCATLNRESGSLSTSLTPQLLPKPPKPLPLLLLLAASPLRMPLPPQMLLPPKLLPLKLPKKTTEPKSQCLTWPPKHLRQPRLRTRLQLPALLLMRHLKLPMRLRHQPMLLPKQKKLSQHLKPTQCCQCQLLTLCRMQRRKIRPLVKISLPLRTSPPRTTSLPRTTSRPMKTSQKINQLTIRRTMVIKNLARSQRLSIKL
mmetsp:Transcript_3922/g.4953  ORF Transcript_3922/g.4953 Transcript_3922/m.4953 type:complete len:204 (+) Transcript_3922:762-1373(+)